MNRSPLLSGLCLALTASLALAGCAAMKGASKTPALYGTWDYTMSNPSQGTLTGLMTLGEAEDGGYTGHVTVREMGIDEPILIQSLDLEGPSFTLRGSAAASDFTITGVVDGDTMTGENDVAGVGIFTMNATRVAR